jgi:hypothetical protein
MFTESEVVLLCDSYVSIWLGCFQKRISVPGRQAKDAIKREFVKFYILPHILTIA